MNDVKENYIIEKILEGLSIGEGIDLEFKSARGGIPGSLWETFSAMANTDGGIIVLGIKQTDTGLFIEELPDIQKLHQDFWNLTNNKNKISNNLLGNSDVRILQIDDKPLLSIHVPRATRQQRPIYIKQNPLEGTYRRFNEGDYRCSSEEVKRMLADQSDEPADSRILKKFTFDDLDLQTVSQFRNRFSSRAPDHPWIGESDTRLLEKLGGWRRDRITGEEGLTVAGLLMFGKETSIRDLHGVPQYHLDYRERLSDKTSERWSDRITLDGTWAGNLFQFYTRVIQRLFSDLKVPFQMGPDLFRKDETIVHEALREALVNALVHSDYRGQGGIVIEKYRDRFELSNPGTLLVSLEQVIRGGVSECRNKSLQIMFQCIGGGEKAGSGMDKIQQGWKSQNWRSPVILQEMRPDRIKIIMPMVSLLPETSLEKMRRTLGEHNGGLNSDEVLALVTADVEGTVTNTRLQQLSKKHTYDLTKMLQDLCSKNLLEKSGHGRWASYQLSSSVFPAAPSDLDPSSPHINPSSPHINPSSPHMANKTQKESDRKRLILLKTAEPVFNKSRRAPEESEAIILDLCRESYLSLKEIAQHLNRSPKGVRDRFLNKMVEDGRLEIMFPGNITHPRQAYRARGNKEK